MSRRAWAAFAAASVIWGMPYLFIRIAVRGGMTPFVLAWGRITLAAIVLLALAWRAGALKTLRGQFRWLFVYAVAEVTFPFPLIAFGEQRVSSSLAAIVIAQLVALNRSDPTEPISAAHHRQSRSVSSMSMSASWRGMKTAGVRSASEAMSVSDCPCPNLVDTHFPGSRASTPKY